MKILKYFLIIVPLITNSQTTWIKTYYQDLWFSFPDVDTFAIGPQEIISSLDGSILALTVINPENDTYLYSLDTLGNVLWTRHVGQAATLSDEICRSLYPTQDSGSIFIVEHVTSPNMAFDSLYRLKSNGSVKWAKLFTFPDFLKNIAPTYNNTWLLNFYDSLVEIDDMGNYLRHRAPFSADVLSLVDSNLVVMQDTILSKESFGGLQHWSITVPLYSRLWYADMNYIYISGNGQVYKINTLNGNIIWSIPQYVRYFCRTSDDGFIITYDDEISKYDLSGNQQWSTNKVFPQLGFKDIHQLADGSYLTGGSWKSKYLITPDVAYSSFITRIDNLGRGVIDSTDYFYAGNANDNGYLSFGDDAVYIAAAFNSTGFLRSVFSFSNWDSEGLYATDWLNRFGNGLNHKYSDYDGNGIIDINDIILLGGLAPTSIGNVTPHWLRISDFSNSSASLYFNFENDSVTSGDTLKINVILGGDSIVIDSIYGLSFDLRINGISSSAQLGFFYEIKPTSLGDTLVNLFTYNRSFPSGIPTHTSMVLCRTDHTNAILNGDTVVVLNYIIPSNINFFNPISATATYSAITEAGFPITLNVKSDSIFMYGGTTSIDEPVYYRLFLYPNPANKKLMLFSKDEKINLLSTFDISGKLIEIINMDENNYELDINEYDPGIYVLNAITQSNKIIRKKFVVVH